MPAVSGAGGLFWPSVHQCPCISRVSVSRFCHASISCDALAEYGAGGGGVVSAGGGIRSGKATSGSVELPAQACSSSGLVVEYDDVLGWQTEDASLAIFQASEKARGVPLHDIASRLQRLLREASEIDANRP